MSRRGMFMDALSQELKCYDGVWYILEERSICMELIKKYKLIHFIFDVLNYYPIGDDKEILRKFREDGFYILQCDASYDAKIRRGTAAIVIKSPDGREYKPRSFKFKSCGPVHAEIKSIVYGLREIKKIRQDIKKVLILNDNKYAIKLVAGNWSPQREYIKSAIKEVHTELKNIKCEVRLGHVRSRLNRRVDRRAKKKLRKVREEVDERIAKRIEKIVKNIEKGKQFKEYEVEDSNTVKLKDPGSNYWFIVKFEPYPSCTCYWWSKNWGNKGEYVIRTRALPCSHMCRAAELLGKNIFHIFRKQIWRGD